MRFITPLCALCLFIAGCSPLFVDLNPGAESVKSALESSSELAKCEYVGILNARLGDNFVGYETNAENVQKQIKNQAHEQGVTHLVWGEPTAPESSNIFGMTGCDNCVALSAKAFRCPQSAPVVAAQP